MNVSCLSFVSVWKGSAREIRCTGDDVCSVLESTGCVFIVYCQLTDAVQFLILQSHFLQSDRPVSRTELGVSICCLVNKTMFLRPMTHCTDVSKAHDTRHRNQRRKSMLGF